MKQITVLGEHTTKKRILYLGGSITCCARASDYERSWARLSFEGFARALYGDDVEMLSMQDPSILAEVREAGFVTTKPAARLIGMFMKAAEEGCDAMLNLCSSVGEVADCAQDAAKYIGVPIVRVDEEMCREAVRLGKRIGTLARGHSAILQNMELDQFLCLQCIGAGLDQILSQPAFSNLHDGRQFVCKSA